MTCQAACEFTAGDMALPGDPASVVRPGAYCRPAARRGTCEVSVCPSQRMPMSREHAISYLNRVVRILDEGHFDPRDEALILSSLAQVEATLELADKATAGLPLSVPGNLIDVLEEFSVAALQLSRRLGDST